MTHDPRPGRSTDLLNVAVVLASADHGPDLGEVPWRGQRRNRTRRVVTTCAGVITAAAIIAGAAAATGTMPRMGAPADSARHRAGAPAAPVAARPVAGPASTRPASNPPADESEGRISTKRVGELIKTDTAHSGGKLTLWFSESDDNRLYLSLGARNAEGALRSFGSAVAADDRLAGVGFEATYDAVNGDSEPRAYALVGIVTGDVSRVTLTVDGKPRTARVAPWSADPRVHAWWVLGGKLDRWPGKSQPLTGQVSNLTAYGPDGKVIARGDDGDIVYG